MKHIPDSLWSELEKSIPQKKNNVGRPEFNSRKTLNGIIYVLYTGIQWNMLSEKYGCPMLELACGYDEKSTEPG